MILVFLLSWRQYTIKPRHIRHPLGTYVWQWLDSGIFYLEWIHKCDITPANMSSVWVSGRCKVTSVIFHWVKIISVCRTRTFSDKCDTKATLEQMCVQDGSANRGEHFAWQNSPEILPVWPSAGDFGRKKWPPSNLLAKTLILVYFTYFPILFLFDLGKI
jgi:hypothetical protein